MEFTKSDLPAFIEKSDALGGPDHPATQRYWSGFLYRPSVTVDTRLDPDSADYLSQMMNLYEEISGRQFDQKANELINVNVQDLVDGESPYAGSDPSKRAVHYLRLAKSLQLANLSKNARVLDMGCGWGLSSELLAQLGFHVHAVDINPLFVDLVRRRAKRLNLNIEVSESSFDEYRTELGSLDAVVFYECLHHAVSLNNLIGKIHSFLRMTGKLILAGEPINDLWWPHWGLRLDALSVYCIRKFGWFENGWSASYLRRILSENNFIPVIFNSPDPSIGTFVIAAKSWTLSKSELEQFILPNEWWIEKEWLVSNRVGKISSLRLCKPRDAQKVIFEIWNHSPALFEINIQLGHLEEKVTLSRGGNQIKLNCSDAASLFPVNFVCSPWRPSELLGTNDTRALGFHLKQITFAQ